MQMLKNVFFKLKKTFANYTLNQCIDLLDENQIEFLFKNSDLSKVNDSVLLNPSFFNLINWHNVDKIKAIRIASRNKEVANEIPLEIYEYDLKDIVYYINACPSIINRLSIDFENISTRDLVKICSEGHEEVLNKIDFDQFNLKETEILKLAKAFNFNDSIFDKLHIYSIDLKNRSVIREIIFHTGSKYISNLNTEILSNKDWLYILESQPEMRKYINLNVFLTGDSFYLVKLALMFPDYITYLDDNKLKELSSLGWEKLLINYPDEFKDKCNLSSLEKKQINSIKEVHPEKFSF